MTIPIPLPLQRPTRANPAAENKSPGRHVRRATGAGGQRDLAAPVHHLEAGLLGAGVNLAGELGQGIHNLLPR